MSVLVSPAQKKLENTRTIAVRWAIVIAFYTGFTLVLTLILTDTLKLIVPEGMAIRIGHNSEAYLFVLVVAFWIQFVRPALNARNAGTRWFWTGLASLFWIPVSLWMFHSDPNDLPYRIKTLNETTVALVLLIPYLMLPRPLPRWIFLSIPALVGMTVWGINTSPEGLIVDLAEAYGFWILAIIAFDAIDRGILNPAATTNAVVRWIWYLFLFLEPVVVSVIGTEAREGGGFEAELLLWLGRVHESFIGILAVSLLFAVALGRTGRRSGPSHSRDTPES